MGYVKLDVLLELLFVSSLTEKDGVAKFPDCSDTLIHQISNLTLLHLHFTYASFLTLPSSSLFYK